MKSIIEIMKLVGSPRSHLLALLEIICESFPTMETWLGGFEFVKVTCFDLHHCVHDVSAVGFVLLELAEGALGSSEQKVLCVFSVTGALASALRSRMRRQEGKGDQ